MTSRLVIDANDCTSATTIEVLSTGSVSCSEFARCKAPEDQLKLNHRRQSTSLYRSQLSHDVSPVTGHRHILSRPQQHLSRCQARYILFYTCLSTAVFRLLHQVPRVLASSDHQTIMSPIFALSLGEAQTAAALDGTDDMQPRPALTPLPSQLDNDYGQRRSQLPAQFLILRASTNREAAVPRLVCTTRRGFLPGVRPSLNTFVNRRIGPTTALGLGCMISVQNRELFNNNPSR